jgi:Fe-S-cluster containining protein
MSINSDKLNNLSTLKCFMCGLCCKEYRVVVNIKEGKKLAENMGLDWKSFKNDYLEKYYVARDRFLIRQIDDSCIFLDQVNDKQSICKINEFKPASCFEWQANASKTECKTGLKQIWNLDISPDGEITGVEADVRNFDIFFDSIV